MKKYLFILLPLFMGCSKSDDVNVTNKDTTIMVDLSKAVVTEYVTFKTKEGVDEQTFTQAAFGTDAILNATEGFIHRYLARQEDGTWTEVVFWEDLDQAKEGLQQFLVHPDAATFLGHIEEGSVSIEYATLFKKP